MLKASGAMAAATLFSRVLGMVREIVYARFMGDGWVAGAFQFAFTIPNLFRRLLGEGLWLRPIGNVVVVMPPLVISERQLRRLVRALSAAIRDECGDQ